MSRRRHVAPLLAVLLSAGSTRAQAAPPPAPTPASLAAPAPGEPRPSLPPPAAPRSRALPRAFEATLPSGLRVVVIEHHRRPVLGMYLVLPTGSVDDPAGAAGATHLALQLASDYHERSPSGEELFDEKSLRRQVADLGGAALFSTGPDVSLIGFQGYPQDAGAYIRLLADALVRPRHGEESFTARRNQALDAFEDLEAADPEALQRAVREAAFGAGQPYARSELGTVKDLSRLGIEDVVAQQQVLLAPAGATLLVIGDVQADRVLADARSVLRSWARRSAHPSRSWARGSPAPTGVAFIRRQPASMLIACAARPLDGVRASDAELEVLAAVLGKGFRSRLMLSLREREGLTYTASAEVLRYRNARAFLACAPVSGARADEGVRLLRQALEALRASPPGEEEMARARALLEAERQDAIEDADGLARVWVEALARGLAAPRLEQEAAEVERVTAADVQRVARAVFQPDAVRWIFSGDTVPAATAAAANRLGALRPLRLGR